MAIIISGKTLASNIKEQLKEDVLKYNTLYNRLPHLVVILVGDDPASQSYVKGKEKASAEIGIKNTTIIKDKNIKEEELLELIDQLNDSKDVDGILVQLPLPKHINKDKVLERIRIDKDVDGFHPMNVAKLWQKKKCILPCTPKGIIRMLESQNIDICGKRACVMGRSEIVGLPMYKLLLDRNATVTTVHSKTTNIAEVTKEADILIVAIGKPKFVTADFIKEGAVVIDVGVNRDAISNKLCGDVDFESCKEKASYITKVPGGVGPMTICSLMENTIEAYLNHQNK